MPSTPQIQCCQSGHRVFPVAWQLFCGSGKLSAQNRAGFLVNLGKRRITLLPDSGGSQDQSLSLAGRHIKLLEPTKLSQAYQFESQDAPCLLFIALEILPDDGGFPEAPAGERPLPPEAESLVDSIMSTPNEEPRPALIRALTELAADHFGPQDEDDLSRLINYIRSHLGHPLTTEDLSAALGMAPHQLQTVTRERFGLTPAALLRQERLHFACELLATTRIPIEQIAEKTGYSDRFSFSRAFSAALNVSPNAYREMESTD